MDQERKDPFVLRPQRRLHGEGDGIEYERRGGKMNEKATFGSSYFEP